MVNVAQFGRAPGGHGFETHRSPNYPDLFKPVLKAY